MNIKIHRNQIRTIKPNDPRFLINDGMTIASRAGFEISSGCPIEYKMVLQECINNGWLKPVAYMTEREMMFVGLTED
jgi:hypothetical protein